MFGNPSNSGGGISPFGGMGDVIDNVSQFREKRDAELRHLNQVQQMGRAHHQEMMDLIGQYNDLRKKFSETCRTMHIIAAERDAAYDILRENQSNLGLTREEINVRISRQRELAQKDFDS